MEDISILDKFDEDITKQKISIYLASNSPRRKWILNKTGLKFTSMPSEFNEDQFLENLTSIKKQGALWYVLQNNHKDLIHEICTNLAIQKALMVWEKIKTDSNQFIVLSADTLIYYNQYFLTKPTNKTEAFEMLKFLSGKTHTVITSHCVVNQDKMIITKDIMTLVTFRKLTEWEISSYIETNEPFDKAGAYAIQGEGAFLIDTVVGDYLNVIGLSLNAVLFLLKEIKI
ncbi:MAG: septum formation protein Maf [Leptospiraceae bacterium]|nr:MAG: septum formation protein Maf [Leptospiraceae bacterium]